MVNWIACWLSTYSKLVNGSVNAEYFPLAAVLSDAASRAWSNAGPFVFAVTSTTTNSLPPLTDFRYQSRGVPAMNVGVWTTL